MEMQTIGETRETRDLTTGEDSTEDEEDDEVVRAVMERGSGRGSERPAQSGMTNGDSEHHREIHQNGVNGDNVDTREMSLEQDRARSKVLPLDATLRGMATVDEGLLSDLYLMVAFRDHLRPPLTNYMLKFHRQLKEREVAFHNRIDDRNAVLEETYLDRYAERASIARTKAQEHLKLRAAAEKAYRHQKKAAAAASRLKQRRLAKRAAAEAEAGATTEGATKKAKRSAGAGQVAASDTSPAPEEPGSTVSEADLVSTKDTLTKAEKKNLAKIKLTQPSASSGTNGLMDDSDPYSQIRSFEEIQEIGTRLHQQIAKVSVGKVYRSALAGLQNRQSFARRLSGVAAREQRRAMTKSAKFTKDVQSKAKKAMREMLMFWKQNEREERELRKKAEKEAIDRARHEEEQREAKRQARKLNFLITQTELYSHFIGKKIRTDEAEDSADTAPAEKLPMPKGLVVPQEGKTTHDQLEDLDFDDEDESNLRRHAERNAQKAVDLARQRAEDFDQAAVDPKHSQLTDSQFEGDDLNFQNPTTLGSTLEVTQPKMLQCELKEYQLKGLNWLANLYEQGINGILADEMGLGKTVQSISLMAYLAEHHDIWGPFLVIAPASTLHNWQQEISRFVPSLKALPYWGNAKDRMILRKFWNRRQMKYTRDAPFHVLVTSYQLVVSDERYFQRVKWQYMVLDEAQAIKSSTSARWKTLLGFHCRNRLLLTGTPIQNSMQELWALLHFIMPSLFDSHDEFSDWFSKDIENHAENKGSLNEHQLRRLHMILKPFMLRRIKKNVQNELGDKIELDVFCGLTPRQKVLYHALRSKVSLKDILEKASSMNDDESMNTLLNLVMQFRKVCNHPDLFERADVEAPLAFGSRNSTPASLMVKETDYLEIGSQSLSHLIVPLPALYSDTEHGVSRVGELPSWFQKHFSLGCGNCRGFGDYQKEVLLHGTRRLHSDTEALIVGMIFDQSTLEMMELVRTYGMDIYTAPTTARIHMPKALAPPPALLARASAGGSHKWIEICDQLVREAILGMPSEYYNEPRTVDTFRAQHPLIPLDNLWKPSLQPTVLKVPAMQQLMSDSGKLGRLDALLRELKAGDHRVLIYFQMTRMIDLMEEYLAYRQYKYLRLDGSSKISDRRDMVMDWQTRPDIFVFLLSTRAGGLGINLTAADTVIFYDSDWNPTVDQQAMDRAHRLGQTRQVTVYRLITRGTIEERIRLRAKQKDEIQKIVISGGEYKQSVEFTRQRELASLLFDDDEIAASMPLQTQPDPAISDTGAILNAGGKKGSKQSHRTSDAAVPSAKRGFPRSLESMWHENEPWFEESGTASPPAVDTAVSTNPSKRKAEDFGRKPKKSKKSSKGDEKKGSKLAEELTKESNGQDS